MRPGANPIEKLKAEKDGLDMLGEIGELAARHGGWETLDKGDRERLKWIGTFFRKPTPGQFMMRVRITNGQTTSTQLRALADIAERLGNGFLDQTTRQQIQLRAIKLGEVPEILEALQGIDLNSFQTGMDNIRNVNCCPLAGLTAGELFDASSAGAEYTEIFLRNPAFTNLPRKFNVTITGCRENCTHSETQDIAMTPAVLDSDGTPGFNVAVGGKMGSGGMTVAQPLDVFAAPHEGGRLAAEITLLFRDAGARGPADQGPPGLSCAGLGGGTPAGEAGGAVGSAAGQGRSRCEERQEDGPPGRSAAGARRASQRGAVRSYGPHREPASLGDGRPGGQVRDGRDSADDGPERHHRERA